MDKWLESPRQYPRLTIDTLAFAIALDILHNPDDHVEFIPVEAEDRLELDIVDAVHADTPNRWPLCTFVAGPRDSYNSPDDRHYSAAGQRELGRRMWQQYREMCAEQLADYGAR